MTDMKGEIKEVFAAATVISKMRYIFFIVFLKVLTYLSAGDKNMNESRVCIVECREVTGPAGLQCLVSGFPCSVVQPPYELNLLAEI